MMKWSFDRLHLWLFINAIKYNSGNPIFMDVDEFFNIDENKTIEFILNNILKKLLF